MKLTLTMAQVQAIALAGHAAQLACDVAHLSHNKYPGGIYFDAVLEQVAEARKCLDYIEAAAKATKGVAA